MKSVSQLTKLREENKYLMIKIKKKQASTRQHTATQRLYTIGISQRASLFIE
jgi:molybdenum cofactor biosynthesis enzyme